jgi:hypothetical protein
MTRFNSAQLKRIMRRHFPAIAKLTIKQDRYSSLTAGTVINVRFAGGESIDGVRDFVMSHANDKHVWMPVIKVGSLSSLE